MVIGKDGKTMLINHGGLLRNVTKIYITRIQGLQGERLCGNEDSDDDEDVRRLNCSKVVDEGKDT